jgi:hypothetical protein
MSELLEKVQKEGVGEYATEMMEYFKMLQLDETAKIRHFVRGLKFGIKETVLASGPTSLLMALRKAKEAESAYELSGKNWGPLDGINRKLSQTVQRTVQEEVNLLRDALAMIDFSLELEMLSLRATGPRDIVIGKGLIEGGQEIMRDTKGNEVENLPVLAIVLQQPRKKGLQYRETPRRQTN